MSDDKGTVVQPKRIQIVFADEPHTPLFYVNAMQVLVGTNEIQITLGAVKPPQLRGPEDLEKLDQLEAEPIFRCAVSHQVFKDFVDLMTAQYANLVRQNNMMAQSSSQEAGANRA